MKSNKCFEDPAQKTKHCLRRNGTERAWFFTREEAEAFAASASNPNYHGDIAHLCAKCNLYHLSKPSWLEPQFTQADYQMLEAAGIETAPLGRGQREGEEFFILRSGSLRCAKHLRI